MPKSPPVLINLRVVLIVIALIIVSWQSPITWLLILDYFAWLLKYPERQCDTGVFKTSDWPKQLYELVPNNRFNFYFGSRLIWKHFTSVTQTVNSHGFRGPEPPPPDDDTVLKVLVLGDSIAFGEGVPDGEEFLQRIEQHWQEEIPFPKPIRFINTAVGGYNTTQELAAAKRYLPQYKPDVVWLFVSLEDSLPWGAVEVTEDGRLFRPGAPLKHRIRDRLKSLSGLLWWFHEAYRYVRLDSYIPRLFQPDFPGYQEWKRTLREFSNMFDSLEEVIVFITIASWKLHNYPWKSVHKLMQKDIESFGFRCIDTLPAFEGQDTSKMWCHPLDVHPNSNAHRIYADFISNHQQVKRWVKKRMLNEESSNSQTNET